MSLIVEVLEMVVEGDARVDPVAAVKYFQSILTMYF